MARRASPVVLEVERKFRSLAVRDLTAASGIPPFQSLRPLGKSIIHDIYYDRGQLLSSAGLWVRQRNGSWEAKVKKGGNFTNSRFEELSDPLRISHAIKALTGINPTGIKCFGLEPIADLTTVRRSWMANQDFKIVEDEMDFGYVVGEVELQHELSGDCESKLDNEERKAEVMQEMDEKIGRFMSKYSWAFCQGEPEGKLTAYFKKKLSPQLKSSDRS
jgi:thiamine-triphosphatase